MSKPKNELNILVNKVKNMFNGDNSLEKMSNMKERNSVIFNNMNSYNRSFVESNYVPITNIGTSASTNDSMPDFVSDDMVINSFLATLGVLGIYMLYRFSLKN